MQFEALLSRIRPKFNALAALLKTVVMFSNRARIEIKQRQHRLSGNLNELLVKRSRVFEMREDGSYSKDQFVERLRVIDEDTSVVRFELDAAIDRSVDVGPTVLEGLAFVRTLFATWRDLAPHLKRRFQKVIFPQGISYDPKMGFGTAILSPIFERIARLDGLISLNGSFDGIIWNQVIDDLLELKAIYKESQSGKVPDVPNSLDPPFDQMAA